MKILNSLDTNKVDFIEAQTQLMLFLGKFFFFVFFLFVRFVHFVGFCNIFLLLSERTCICRKKKYNLINSNKLFKY